MYTVYNRIFAKGSYFILGQIFCQSRQLPSRRLWVELMSCYVHIYIHNYYMHALTITQICQNFHCVKKKLLKKIFANSRLWWNWWKFFSWRKFLCIQYNIVAEHTYECYISIQWWCLTTVCTIDARRGNQRTMHSLVPCSTSPSTII